MSLELAQISAFRHYEWVRIYEEHIKEMEANLCKSSNTTVSIANNPESIIVPSILPLAPVASISINSSPKKTSGITITNNTLDEAVEYSSVATSNTRQAVTTSNQPPEKNNLKKRRRVSNKSKRLKKKKIDTPNKNNITNNSSQEITSFPEPSLTPVPQLPDYSSTPGFSSMFSSSS